MSNLTSIISSDLVSAAPSVLTGNFQNINQDKLESNQSSVLAYGVITGAATGANTVTSSVLVGSSGQVLTSRGAGVFPSFQTVTQVVPSVLTYIPYSQNFIDPGGTSPGAAITSLTSPSVMAIGKVIFPFQIQASVISFFIGNTTSSVAGFDLTLYAENGQSQVFSTTTSSNMGSGDGIVVAALSSVLAINPGIYYIGINTNAAGSAQPIAFQTEANGANTWNGLLNNPSIVGSAVVEGTLPIGAGTPPSTITPSVITLAEDSTLIFRIN